MKTTPTVSVVIAAYNASRWIGETLESVLAQDYTDCEIILVDDGSTDDTAQIVARYGERVRYIHKSNGGQPSARNVGIRAAQGEYVAFLDADDLWTKEKLRLQVDLLHETGRAWTYSDAFVFDSESGDLLHRAGQLQRLYEGDILEPLFLGNFILSPTPVVRRSVFEQVGYFDEDEAVHIGEDWYMWLRIAACYPVGLVSKPLAHYRVHTQSMTGGGDPLPRLTGYLTVIERMVAREPVKLNKLRTRAIANVHVAVGRIMIRHGDLAQARKMFIKALQYYPNAPDVYLFWVSTLLSPKITTKLIRIVRSFRRRGIATPTFS